MIEAYPLQWPDVGGSEERMIELRQALEDAEREIGV